LATYRSFVDALEALSITGVSKTFTSGPPRSLKTAQLPAQWVQMPTGAEAAVHKGAPARGWQTLRAELVVAYEAVGQGTQPTNFDGTVDMMDSVATAVAAATGLGKAAQRYELRMEEVGVGGNAYWAVVASVEVEG